MTNPTCTLTATLKGKSEKRDELLELLTSFLAKSRSEEGCIEYQLQVSNDDPDTFVFYENWVTRGHLDRHMELPYQQAWFVRQPDLLAEPAKMQFYTIVAEFDSELRK